MEWFVRFILILALIELFCGYKWMLNGSKLMLRINRMMLISAGWLVLMVIAYFAGESCLFDTGRSGILLSAINAFIGIPTVVATFCVAVAHVRH